MKNIFKKNQVVICTIALMLIVAGYMNYTINIENSLETAKYVDTEQYAEIGDATLVSTSNVEVENNITQNIIANNNVETNTKETSAIDNNNSNQYFSQSKIDRNNMYSEQIETYQKILNNNQTPETQKAIASTEIEKINTQKNAIMIVENLIQNKGFKNVLIFINGDSVNAIIEKDNLEEDDVAQIQNIIQRELKAEVKNIHITNKK